jgi:hypothetical protein
LKLKKLSPLKLERYKYQGFLIEQKSSGDFAISLYQRDLFNEPFMYEFKPRRGTVEEAKRVVDRLRKSLTNDPQNLEQRTAERNGVVVSTIKAKSRKQ